MHRLFHYLRLATVLLLVVVSTVAMTAFYYLQGSAPQWQGRLIVPGLRDRVEILRTENGVPDIRANQASDIAFALGFSQAQDQFFAMDVLRRQASGELAELIGPGGLASDRLTIPLDLQGATDRQVTELSPEAREQLSAFARGVNAALDQMAHAPLEYLLLRAEPRRWTINDSLLVLAGLRHRMDRPAWALAALERAAGRWPDALRTFLFSPGQPSPASADDIPLPLEETGSLGVSTRTLPAAGLQLMPDVNDVARWTGHTDFPWPWYPARWQQQGAAAIAGVVMLGTPALFAGSNGELTWHSLPSGDPSQPLRWVNVANDTASAADAEPVTETRIAMPVRGQQAQSATVQTTRWGPVVIRGANLSGVAGTRRADTEAADLPASLAPWLYADLGPRRTMLTYGNGAPDAVLIGSEFETGDENWQPLRARDDYAAIDWAYWQGEWQESGGDDVGFESVRAFRHATLEVLFGPALSTLDPMPVRQAWPLLNRALEWPARALLALQPDGWLPAGQSSWTALATATVRDVPETASALSRAGDHPLVTRFPALSGLFRLTLPSPETPDGAPPIWLETPAAADPRTAEFLTVGPINRHLFQRIERPISDPRLLIRQNGSIPIGHQLNLLPERERP